MDRSFVIFSWYRLKDRLFANLYWMSDLLFSCWCFFFDETLIFGTRCFNRGNCCSVSKLIQTCDVNFFRYQWSSFNNMANFFQRYFKFFDSFSSRFPQVKSFIERSNDAFGISIDKSFIFKSLFSLMSFGCSIAFPSGGMILWGRSTCSPSIATTALLSSFCCEFLSFSISLDTSFLCWCHHTTY